MGKTICARYDGKVLLPEGPVDLEPQRRYRLRVEEELPPGAEPDPWDVIESLIGTVPGPEDWARNHDHYLYGLPRREKRDE